MDILSGTTPSEVSVGHMLRRPERLRLTRQRGGEGGHHVGEEEVASQECEHSQGGEDHYGH